MVKNVTVSGNMVIPLAEDSEFRNPYRYVWVTNNSENDIYASTEVAAVQGSDGVFLVSPKGSVRLLITPNSELYLSGSGDVEIITSGVPDSPFVSSGGGSSHGTSSAYTFKNSLAFSSLPSTLTPDMTGWVYNVTTDFTTSSQFVEGAGKNYPAGTNIAVANVGTAETADMKYDVLGSFVDVSALNDAIDEVSDAVDLLSDSVYTKTEVSSILSDYYTKAQSDNTFMAKSDYVIQTAPTAAQITESINTIWG